MSCQGVGGRPPPMQGRLACRPPTASAREACAPSTVPSSPSHSSAGSTCAPRPPRCPPRESQGRGAPGMPRSFNIPQ